MGLRSKPVYEVFHRMLCYYHADIGFVARSRRLIGGVNSKKRPISIRICAWPWGWLFLLSQKPNKLVQPEMARRKVKKDALGRIVDIKTSRR